MRNNHALISLFLVQLASYYVCASRECPKLAFENIEFIANLSLTTGEPVSLIMFKICLSFRKYWSNAFLTHFKEIPYKTSRGKQFSSHIDMRFSEWQKAMDVVVSRLPKEPKHYDLTRSVQIVSFVSYFSKWLHASKQCRSSVSDLLESKKNLGKMRNGNSEIWWDEAFYLREAIHQTARRCHR